ncbi:Elastin microfibril interfacer 2 [Mactra antiquata]
MTKFVIFTLALLLLSTDVNCGKKAKKDWVKAYVEDRISAFEQKLKEQTHAAHAIGFTAEVSAMDVHYTVQLATILFDRVKVNVGDAYNPTTGIFVAPYAGMYVFTVTGTSKWGKTVTLELTVDGNRVAHIYSDSKNSGSYNSGTKTYVQELEKGSQVSVKMGAWINNYDLHGNGLTSFTGFLLDRY